MPEADGVRAALEACPFVVVSDVIRHTDTTAVGDVLLPSLAWGEKSGTVTNSERRISRQRSFLPPPGEARADWWQLAEMAKRIGFGEAFAWTAPHEIFAEYAALTGIENGGSRDLDISAHAAISSQAYDTLSPFQWPQPAGMPAKDSRFFGNGSFYTPDRRARFVATAFRRPASALCKAYPFVLNTGRVRDQWHTMTRTGKAARLMRHASEPYVEINPGDAKSAGLADDSLAFVTSRHGRIIARVKVTEGQRPGSLFVPMHWTDRMAGNARVDALMHGNCDPVSGQPELKFTPAAIAPFAGVWQGFAVMRDRPQNPGAEYWALAPVASGWQIELAGLATHDWDAFARQLFGVTEGGGAPEVLAYGDTTAGQHRVAIFAEDRLIGALFVATGPVVIARDWLAARLDTPLDPAERFRMLAGRPGGDLKPRGETFPVSGTN